MINDPYQQYRNTLGTRYASSAMSRLFSDRHRVELWRELWIYLADEERKLGLPISPKQIQALERAKKTIHFDRIREIEKKLKHDVMSHLKAFAEEAREAEGILHLGATSAFITDNADALIFKEATVLLMGKILVVLSELSRLMSKYKDLTMSGFTHFQPAQPVTLGKRLGLWAQDLVWNFEELQFVLERFRPLGCKGTTGTQASFMTLFKQKYDLVKKLDENVCKRMGFKTSVSLSGQTLSRQTDTWFLNALANLGASLSKASYDLRLLQHLQQVAEPFEKDQVGSSAMPYKQNPMLSERISGLSRFLMTLSHNASWTHATQWLERSLDDSSNRRLVIPEAFLTADSIVEIFYRILKGLRVNSKGIEAYLKQYAASFQTECEMMEKSLQGESRQKLHEEIRKKMLRGELKVSGSATRKLSGASAQQVVDFHAQLLSPLLKKNANLMKKAQKAFSSSSI